MEGIEATEVDSGAIVRRSIGGAAALARRGLEQIRL